MGRAALERFQNSTKPLLGLGFANSTPAVQKTSASQHSSSGLLWIYVNFIDQHHVEKVLVPHLALRPYKFPTNLGVANAHS